MTETTLGCVSVGVSEAGGICCSDSEERTLLLQNVAKAGPRRGSLGDSDASARAVQGSCLGREGERIPGSLRGSNKTGALQLHGARAIQTGLILPSFPKPNTSPVPLAGPLGQEGRGCRARAESVPWCRHSQSPASLRGEQARHEKVLEDPRELPEPHGREFPGMDRPHSRAVASGESLIPQHPSSLRTGGLGARLQQWDLGSRGRQRGRTQGCLRKV